MTKVIYQPAEIMKIFTTVLLSLFAFLFIKGQDIIHFTDGRIIEAKVVSIGYNKIKFYDYNYIDGPLFSIKDTEVQKIEFEDNKRSLILYQDASYSDMFTIFNRNIISFHASDLTVQKFTLSYERLFSNGKMGFIIPLSIGVSSNSNRQDHFLGGIGLNVYPTGQRRLSYYIGPEVLAGMRSVKDYIYNHETGEYEDIVKNNFFIFRVHISQGLVFTPHNNFSISTNLGLGFRNYRRHSNLSDKVFELSPSVVSSINLSYRF